MDNGGFLPTSSVNINLSADGKVMKGKIKECELIIL